MNRMNEIFLDAKVTQVLNSLGHSVKSPPTYMTPLPLFSVVPNLKNTICFVQL